MTVEAFEAWILHKRPSGDTSVRVTFFTREKGVINCLCKGGRAPKKQAILQAFTPLWVALEVRKEWYYSRQVESTSLPVNIKGFALFAALYMNELLYYTLSPIDPHPLLFDTYIETLRGLSVATDNLAIEALLRRFEWALLIACGQAVSLTKEAHSTNLITEDKYYQFIVSEGFLPAIAGLAGKDILAFAQGYLDDINVLKTAKFIMRQAIDHLLEGRELKSRTLFMRHKNKSSL
ncbi:DNA repair protein RecO (recombination protein O) [Legionella lansingensis]|uniref:DNA repair protein RecO n=1 Tax=Legionella lansingensis TaxID=45067 RepID=A0A0W0VY20_9GAMM|nr:DNA repair protein RecO [Legionella lansingensis]KTD24814.1 DNA repair protein recO [Legionella lansingensis]SNV49059.1 DNA repair protein RecO (recombination protein O) [Legionella lansingensis]